tara:strand:- start:1324 stop:1806 length:483 start_codon:yes stop_codon:yes gene_type:complete
MQGIKHLIQCHCTLPQFRNREEPLFHKFTVFSKIDENGDIVVKFSVCENCGVVHKVYDICKSELLMGVEDNGSVISIKDIRPSLPNKLVQILDEHNCDLATWENVNFIVEEKRWGSMIILKKESMGDSVQIKSITINSMKDFKIESHIRQDEIAGEYTIL